MLFSLKANTPLLRDITSTNYPPFNDTLDEVVIIRLFMAKRISVRAPCRIDLAGGWTDVPNFCSKKSGEVVNIAINKYTKCTMEIDEERKISSELNQLKNVMQIIIELQEKTLII